MAEKEDPQGITRWRLRVAGVAAPSHDFFLMHSRRGGRLEEGEQGRESGRQDLAQRTIDYGR